MAATKPYDPERAHERYLRNREKFLAASARWKKEHPEAVRLIRMRTYYKNREKNVAQSVARNRKIRAMIQKGKEVPCADCGQRYPYYVMDYDHTHGKKLIGLGQYRGGYARARAEMAKCDVVCANCHRKRTHARRCH